tara:strand:- start:11267 stop:13300 length:2034 start_codon:yes stop_codon:yes gene_type:complete
MSRITMYQSNFTQGEVDPLMHGRVDIEQYYSALDRAKNVMIMPQGGFERRPGSKFMFDLTSHLGSYTALAGIRLIPFEFSIDQSFMLLFVKQSSSDVRMFVFANQVQITNINGSGNDYLSINMGDIDLSKINFTQSADTLILVQEDMAPRSIVRGGTNATWTHSTISLTSPFFNFTTSTSNPSATITPDAVDGTVKITASSGVFSSGNVNQYINVSNGFGRARIIEFESSTVVKTMVEIPFFEASVAIASGAWELETGYEEVFSSTKGYPRTCTFHEGRLFFGGSKSLPNTLFGSKVGDFFNFKSSEALADDALFVTLSSDSINSINAIRSGRDLQIFTSSGEFFIPQSTLDPITPSNLVVKSSTRRGIKEGIRPTGTEAATFFIQRSGKSLREFLFSDSDLNYNSNNVSLFSSHLLKAPTKMALRSATSTDDGDLLMIVNSTDGTMAVYTMLRPQNVVAPVEWVTNGEYIDVGVDVEDIYTVVKRTIPTNQTKYYLEVFDDDRTTDAAIQYFSGATSPDQSLPSNTTCGSLNHLEGLAVDVVRDDLVITGKTVSSNAITIDQAPTTYVEVGLSYAVEVKTLPAEPRQPSGVVVSRKRRILEATPVLLLSQNLAINGVEVPFSLLPATAGASSTTFSGRKRISPILGYSDEAQLTLTMTTPQFVTVIGLEYKLSTGA